MAFVFLSIGSAIVAGAPLQLLLAPVIVWLVKRRFMSRVENRVAKTAVTVLDALPFGAPVVFVMAAADLVVTGLTGAWRKQTDMCDLDSVLTVCLRCHHVVCGGRLRFAYSVEERT
jgi:hypothetical protein